MKKKKGPPEHLYLFEKEKETEVVRLQKTKNCMSAKLQKTEVVRLQKTKNCMSAKLQKTEVVAICQLLCVGTRERS